MSDIKSISETQVVELETQTPENEQLAVCPSHTTESALVRRLDFRLIPVLSLLYLMGFISRINISNALTLGLPEEIGLVGNDINSALAVFFVPFILFEIPSNLILRYVKPHIWLSACMFFFGFVVTMEGFIHNYSSLIATRFFLGLTDGTIFPGCFYMMSMWYKREEAQRRFSLFFSTGILAAAFVSFLASAIQNMDGVRGYSGWRWIFILEGTATCLVSICVYFFIPDFPENAKWLREDEKAFMIARTQAEEKNISPSVSMKTTPRRLLTFFSSMKTVCGGVMYFGILIPASGLSFFTPTIVRSYGYSLIQTQLHSIPPYVVAWAASLLLAIFSDKIHLRSLPLAIALAIALAGSTILLAVRGNTSLEYGALFLLATGTYSSMPIMLCWYTMNLSDPWERSIGTGWQAAFGNIGGLVSTFAFTTSDAPFYHKGYSIIMGGLCIAIASSLTYWLIVLRENRQRFKNERGDQDLQGAASLGSRSESRRLHL